MLKYEIAEKGKIAKLEACGTTAEIAADLLTLISNIYDGLDSRVKPEFKARMEELLPVCFMEEDEKEDFLKKNDEGAVENVSKLIDQLCELKDLLEELKEETDETVRNKA